MKELLKVYGPPIELDQESSLKFWGELRRLSVMPFSSQTYLWKISTAPKVAPLLVNAHAPAHGQRGNMYDWSGGLVWLEIPGFRGCRGGRHPPRACDPWRLCDAGSCRPGGAPRRGRVPAAEPGGRAPARGLKAAFDPANVFNPGRMYATHVME